MAGLLSAALPDLEVPDTSSPWTIDPALTLARRAEQALSGVKDDDEAWTRVQRQIGEDFTELQRSLSALGHQVLAEQSDWGLIVNVIYQNRSERPGRFATRLAAEIDQRTELLNANERAVLENHLQAEIASEIQRLLQTAEAQRDAINKELYSRPTSTGVRFRLLWPPLSEEEGAPVGLEAARKRLLNTNADLRSSEDRRVVGAMLQQRIVAEREFAEAGWWQLDRPTLARARLSTLAQIPCRTLARRSMAQAFRPGLQRGTGPRPHRAIVCRCCQFLQPGQLRAGTEVDFARRSFCRH